MDTFWDRVDNRLKKLNAKRPWLAQETGLDLNTMQKRIQNGVLPRVDEAERIARAIGTTIDYLQTGVVNPSIDEPEDVVAVCEAVRRMSREDLLRLQGIVLTMGYQTWKPQIERERAAQ